MWIDNTFAADLSEASRGHVHGKAAAYSFPQHCHDLILDELVFSAHDVLRMENIGGTFFIHFVPKCDSYSSPELESLSWSTSLNLPRSLLRGMRDQQFHCVTSD